MSDDATTICKHQEQLAQKRSNFENWWQEIAYRVMPAAATFTITTDEGQKRTERLFDGHAVTENERFAAVMDDLLTPRSQLWHALAAQDDELNESQEVREYFEQVNKILYSMRYAPKANFASQKNQGYLSVGAFGNSCLFIDELVGLGPRYRQIHMREAYWAENHQGMIDMLYRKFCLQGRQVLQQAKQDGWQISDKLKSDAQKDPWKDFEFIHCVRPNEEQKQGRRDYEGMPWSSYYVSTDGGKSIVHRGGYTSWPYAIGRYMLMPGETYARSPAMAAWPAIMTINEEKKTVLRAGQKEVEPPLLLTDDGALEPFNMRSGALNHGTLSSNGEPLVQPLKTGANIPLGLELMALEQQHIEDSFLASIFKILAEHPSMTATQVLEIAQQKATLLAPTMGRQHSEDLGPLIARELDIAAKANLLPPMPDELVEAGGTYKIEYRSPMARAMRAQDGVAIMRTFEAIPTAISIDPDAAMVIDVKESLRELAEINGVPAKLVRDKRVVAQMMQQKQEADQQAQAVSIAPEMSEAALNAAKAEQLRTGT